MFWQRKQIPDWSCQRFRCTVNSKTVVMLTPGKRRLMPGVTPRVMPVADIGVADLALLCGGICPRYRHIGPGASKPELPPAPGAGPTKDGKSTQKPRQPGSRESHQRLRARHSSLRLHATRESVRAPECPGRTSKNEIAVHKNEMRHTRSHWL